MEQQRSLVQAPVLPLRSRPRLRAKTGCLTCRSRRKKCTERKPQCHGCERLSIQCVWPEAAAEKRAVAKPSSRHNIEKEPAQSSEYSSPLKPLLPGNCLRYKPSLSEDEVLLFRYFNEKYTLLVFEPKVHPGFMNAPLNLLAELKRVRCITDLVLAISAMHLSNKLGRYTRIATEYYVSALGSLRSMVDGGEIEGSEDWLMLMVTLLCLYERWRPDPVSNMLIHLRGAMQVYQLRMKRVGKAPGHVITPFECLVTECTVYNITTLSLFTDLDTDLVSAIFETADYIHRSKPDIGIPALRNSPILRVGPRLHHVICKISQLCRRSPLHPEDQGSLDALADELRIACVAVDEAIGLRPSDNSKRALYPAKLFAIAANIMFYKLQHPEIQASCFWIQSKVQEALHTIQSIPGPYLPWQSICWQMYIVGCAVVRYSDMVFLRGRLQTFWDGSSCGDIARVANALEANWAARGTEGAGLDILLQKRSALYQ